MSLRRQFAGRSPGQWTVRFILAAVTAVLGYYAVTFSIAQVAVKRNPALAYRLAPGDGRITAAYATSLAGENATQQDRLLADRLARRALRQDPTAVAAAATLGLNADFRGDGQAARRYFGYAQHLSRRDLRTQLFMIEYAVARNDIAAALNQYDITLRVFPIMGNLLYPVLASASGDPAIRDALVRTLSRKPLWTPSFLDFIAVKGPDPKSTAVLFARLDRAGVAVPQSARAGVVNALIAAGQYDLAWSAYAAIRPAIDRRRSRDPGFTESLETPSQLDWNLIGGDSGLTAGIQGGVFDFAAPASVGGPMLRQLQLLPAGTYRLTGHSIGIEQASGALPYWTLSCQGGTELGRVEVPNSNVANGNFSGTFSIPAGCPVQALILTARPSDAMTGLSGQIDRLALVPVGQ